MYFTGGRKRKKLGKSSSFTSESLHHLTLCLVILSIMIKIQWECKIREAGFMCKRVGKFQFFPLSSSWLAWTLICIFRGFFRPTSCRKKFIKIQDALRVNERPEFSDMAEPFYLIFDVYI